ncbi:MAG: CPBP family intramembrane metalloprotease [Asgard group archaeon]|nr:CPBP family intramembrane metalloprotease [Asgard group archaeon]
MLEEQIELSKKPSLKEKRLFYSRISLWFSILYISIFNLLGVIFGLIIILILSFLAITIDLESNSPLTIYINLTVNVLAITTIGLTALSINRKTPFIKEQKKLRPQKNDWKLFSIAFSIMIALVGSYQLFVSYLQNNILQEGNLENPYDFFNTDKIGIIIFATFVVTFIAPIAEEIFYRWTLISTLRNGFNKNATIVFSALIFSLAHSFTDLTFSFSYFVIHLIATFIVGIILGYVFYQTENIILTILLHSSWNLIVSSSAFFEFGGVSYVFTIIFSILVGLCLIYLIYVSITHLIKKRKIEEIPNKQDFNREEITDTTSFEVNEKTKNKSKIKLQWAWFELILGYFFLAGIIPIILGFVTYGSFLGEGIIEYFYLVVLAIVGAILLLYLFRKINDQSKNENEIFKKEKE